MYNYHFNRIKKFIIDTIIRIIYNIRNDLFSYLLICIMFISILSEEAIALALVEAQVSILADNPFVAIDLLREQPSMRLSKSQKLQHAFLLGWAYLLTGQLQQSVLSLDEAKKMAVEQKDSYSHIRI